MKKLCYIAGLTLILCGCANAQKQEIAIQKEVLTMHDKLMEEDQKVQDNKMKIDTLLHKADSLKINTIDAVAYSKMLTDAANRMSDWMGKLNLDNSGKNHDDIMKYWETQKATAKQLDSVYSVAISKTNNYLKTMGKK